MNWFRNNGGTKARNVCLLAGVWLCVAGMASAQVTADQAHDLFNSGKMEEACQAFQQLDKTKPGDPQIHPYVNMSCGQVQRLEKTEEDLFNQGVQLFNQVRQTFDEGVQMYKAGRFADADIDFQKVVKAGGPQAAEAQSYLAKIEQAQKDKEQEAKAKETKTPTATTITSNPPKTNEPTNPGPTLNLRAGLKAYFDGDLDAAEGDLSQYLQQNGTKRDLAYFFRGAAHGTRFYLSGEKDSREKQLAVADFQAAKKADRDFQPPSKYIAPKIIKLYAQTAGDPGQ